MSPSTGWVLRGGTLVDGTGAAAVPGTLVTSGERIRAVGPAPPTDGERELNVSGCYVAPGFIDMHSHGDEGYLLVPDADSKVRQGITLDLCGNCGFAVSPLQGAALDEARRSMAGLGLTPTWEDLDGFRRRLDDQGIAVNVAFLAGHGTMRAAVMGYARRPSTDDERLAMARLLERELAQGAFGLSTGLIYPPGCFAETDELIELARVAAAAGGLYASHIRGEGDTLLEAVDEALRIGRDARIQIEISHVKASFPQNWPKFAQALQRIDAARQEGITVSCDQYPYLAGGTGLDSVLPDWAHEGGTAMVLERLRNPEQRAVLARAVAAGRPAEVWETVMVASARADPVRRYQGMTIAAIAAEHGWSPAEAALEVILRGDGQVGAVFFSQSEENVRRGLARPDIAVGSDSGVAAPHGRAGQGHPHPRTYGTFPRILGRYVRDERLLSWEAAVHKMTGLPAGVLGLNDRGRLAAGCVADLVVFDPETIVDRATYTAPHQFPAGIRHVFINGTPVILEGSPTGARPGRVIASPGKGTG